MSNLFLPVFLFPVNDNSILLKIQSKTLRVSLTPLFPIHSTFNPSATTVRSDLQNTPRTQLFLSISTCYCSGLSCHNFLPGLPCPLTVYFPHGSKNDSAETKVRFIPFFCSQHSMTFPWHFREGCMCSGHTAAPLTFFPTSPLAYPPPATQIPHASSMHQAGTHPRNCALALSMAWTSHPLDICRSGFLASFRFSFKCTPPLVSLWNTAAVLPLCCPHPGSPHSPSLTYFSPQHSTLSDTCCTYWSACPPIRSH